VEIRIGDQVLVNLAPFIGLEQWCKNAVACDVVEVGENRIRIMTRPPCREVELWVACDWIEQVLERARIQGSSGGKGTAFESCGAATS
jgi:hypothetical protein